MEQRTGAELTGLLVSVCTESSLQVGMWAGQWARWARVLMRPFL